MMKHIMIGTAGHIDHGKTALVKALTGKDLDTLAEEKKRGITIELGFTDYAVDTQITAGIIDVPGHEKLIHTMIAGAAGIDLALLIVAADEGIMPQTREHLSILEFLSIERVLIVINKCDLVDDEFLELVRDDISAALAPTPYAHAPMVCVSAVTGAGMDELRAAIADLARAFKPREGKGAFRLPIDRIFSKSGFGTIVTGTLFSGTVSKEDEFELYPTGQHGRIRAIQVHHQSCEQAVCGQRTALNLTGVEKSELKRGMVVAAPDSLSPSGLLDARVFMGRDSGRSLQNQIRLHLCIGTSQLLCRAVLLDCEELSPGANALVQLHLEEPVAVRKGDRFILRFYSPVETIAGGVILDAFPKRHKRFQEDVLHRLSLRESNAAADLEHTILTAGCRMPTFQELLSSTHLNPEELQELLNSLKEQECILELNSRKQCYYLHRTSAKQALQLLSLTLSRQHQQYPYQHGIRKSQLYTSLFPKIPASMLELIFSCFLQNGQLCQDAEYIRLPEFSIPHDALYRKLEKQAITQLTKAGFQFLRRNEVSLTGGNEQEQWDIWALLCEEGKIIPLDEDFYSVPAVLEAARERVLTFFEQQPVITLIDLRDALGTSRKCIKPLFLYLDAQHITKKGSTELERLPYRNRAGE